MTDRPGGSSETHRRARVLLAGSVLLALAAGGVLFAGGCEREEDPPRVEINGHVWRVEIARTNDERYQGLGGRAELADGEGMLFLYPRARRRSYCMRDCLIPLDIAYIGPDRRVVHVDTMAVEPDRAGRVLYPSVEPAQYVLEVRAGALEAAGVRPGDRATFLGDIPDAAKAEPGA